VVAVTTCAAGVADRARPLFAQQHFDIDGPLQTQTGRRCRALLSERRRLERSSDVDPGDSQQRDDRRDGREPASVRSTTSRTQCRSFSRWDWRALPAQLELRRFLRSSRLPRSQALCSPAARVDQLISGRTNPTASPLLPSDGERADRAVAWSIWTVNPPALASAPRGPAGGRASRWDSLKSEYPSGVPESSKRPARVYPDRAARRGGFGTIRCFTRLSCT